MGKVLSLFRVSWFFIYVRCFSSYPSCSQQKEKSTYQVLSALEEEILELENYTLCTRESHRKFAGRFLVVSIGTFVVAFIIFYLYFYPPTWVDRLLYSTPLLVFPFV